MAKGRISMMEDVRKVYREKAKQAGFDIRFNNPRSLTLSNKEQEFKLIVKFHVKNSHCLSITYTNFARSTPSRDMLQLLFDYSCEFAAAKEVDLIEFPKSYAFFFQQHCIDLPTKWVYARTDTYRPSIELVREIQRLNQLWQQTNPTLRLKVEFPIHDVSSDTQFINLIYYQTGENGSLVAYFDQETSRWSFYQGKELMGSATIKNVETLLNDFLQKVHNRNRLETAFTPLRVYFDRLCKKGGLTDKEKQSQWFGTLCEEYGSHEVEEMCARCLLDTQIFYQTTISQKSLSLFRLGDKWYVMGNWGVRTFTDQGKALSCFEQCTLTLTWGKNLTKQLQELKRKDETNDNGKEDV